MKINYNLSLWWNNSQLERWITAAGESSVVAACTWWAFPLNTPSVVEINQFNSNNRFLHKPISWEGQQEWCHLNTGREEVLQELKIKWQLEQNRWCLTIRCKSAGEVLCRNLGQLLEVATRTKGNKEGKRCLITWGRAKSKKGRSSKSPGRSRWRLST